MGVASGPVAEPEKSDSRFKDEDWSKNFLFDLIKQSYLISSRHIREAVASVDGLSEESEKKVAFFTRQYVDALAPSNFLMTNPQVLRETVASGGQNLVRGLNNLLNDLEKGGGKLRISMTDESAFQLGRNVATTPGKVVYQTELMQLIQYSPLTEQVYKRPLVIVPPWINKYYILDLREKNSFIRWAVSQGHTVFVVSWVNPDARLAQKGFEDYMLEGPIAALDAVEKATGSRQVNFIGYCLGGTLLGATLAYLNQKQQQDRVASATFFVSLLDFSQPGELGVFIDEEQVQNLERKMNERGYLEGSEMAGTFNLLRANDLVWSFVVNNYLLGKGPFPVRPAVLERRLDAHAGAHAQLLPAQHVHPQCDGQTGRHRARRRADRPLKGEPAGILYFDGGGSHRAVEDDLQGCTVSERPGALRPRRLGPHRRHRQPAGGEKIPLLDQRFDAAVRRRVVRLGRAKAGFVVGRLAALDRAARRRQGPRAHSRRGRAEGDRGRSRQLRQDAHPF